MIVPIATSCLVRDVPIILHAEMYDRNGKLVRELHASALKKVCGIWGVIETPN